MPASASTGYSGTPLWKKIGVKPGSNLLLLSAPDAYLDWLAPLPEGVRFHDAPNPSITIAHLFVTQKSVLGTQLETLRKQLAPDACIWVSWPKKSARQATDITEDAIRALALPLGLVDIKVCAVSEIWSGLKLVVRKELR